MATTWAVDLLFRTQGGGKIRNLSNQLQGVERSGKGAQAGLDRASRSMDRMSGKARTAATALGGLVKGFLAFQGIKFAVGAAAEIERTQKQLETLTGSASEALRVYKELQQVNRESPFELRDLTAAAAKLSAFGVATSDLVDTTRRLGQVAAGTGQDISGIALAYGQVLAKGRLQGEELLQFQERGIPLAAELQKKLKLSGEEFQKLVSQGKIGSQLVVEAMKDMTSETGRFGKAFENTAGTIDAKLSNLKDAFYNAAGALVKAFEPQLKWLIDRFTDVANYFIRVFNRLSDLQKGGARQQAELQASAAAQKATRDKFGVLGSLSPEAKAFREAYRKNELFNFEAGRAGDGGIKPVTKPPSRPGPTPGPSSSSSSKEGEKLARELERSLAAGTQLSREFSRQVQMLKAEGEIEKALLQVQFDKQDRELQIAELKSQEQQATAKLLSDELARLQTLQAMAPLVEQMNKERLMGASYGDGKVVEQLNPNGKIGEYLKQTNDWLNDTEGRVVELAGTIEGQLAGAFASVIDGSKSAQEAFSDMFRGIAASFLQMATQMIAKMIIMSILNKALGGILGGGTSVAGAEFGSFSGGSFGIDTSGLTGPLKPFADGGIVRKPTAALIGEAGPEAVIPLSEMSKMNGEGGDTVVNITLNGVGGGSSSASGSKKEEAAQLARMVEAATVGVIQRERRPGGLLAR